MVNLVAEIGINYAYGEDKSAFLQNAIDLMTQAKLAGFNYVKLQKRTPSECVPEKMKDKARWTPWRKDLNATYLQYKEDIEFTIKQWDVLFSTSRDLGIQLFASVWDMNALHFMEIMQKRHYKNYGMKTIVKIPSAKITDLELCKAAREKFDVLMISTGMSTEEEIEKCVTACDPDVIFHTHSEYPSELCDLNLNYIKHLQKKYPLHDIGYSGHEYGLDTTIATVALGVKWIERHVTMSHDLWGTDQKSSIEPVGMFKLVKGVRELEAALGDPSIADKDYCRELSREERKKRETLQ